MVDESKRVILGDSLQPKMDLLKKSLTPKAPNHTTGVGEEGASTQPKAPQVPTQQAKPPPGED